MLGGPRRTRPQTATTKDDDDAGFLKKRLVGSPEVFSVSRTRARTHSFVRLRTGGRTDEVRERSKKEYGSSTARRESNANEWVRG